MLNLSLTSLRYRFERLLLRLLRFAPQARPPQPHRGCSGCPSARLFQTLETRPRLPSVSPGLGNETLVPRRWTTCRCFAGNTHKATPQSPWHRYPRGSQRAKHPLRYQTSHGLIASTLIAPPVGVKRTHVFEGISSKTQAHGSSKQSDQTMAQPEVAPNVTTGITQVMPHKKWWGHWWCIL